MNSFIDRQSPGASLLALLNEAGVTRAMGSHSPLSARLAAQAGFDVIWSSGLEISATAGVPDANILAMTECLDVAGAMADAVDLPVLADCDSGFGNVTNVMHMVRGYVRRGIAGICIEDKRFPKLNSFVEGDQELVPVADFAAKIRAATQARGDADLVVVARLEALIAGLGLAEALHRADVYERAGADALLIHSKRSEPDEVFAFRESYTGSLPVIAVPTTYSKVTVSEFADRGFAMVIYANHALRSSVQAMRRTLNQIMRDGTTRHIEDEIVPMEEIFHLQGVSRMLSMQRRLEAEGRELAATEPTAQTEVSAVTAQALR